MIGINSLLINGSDANDVDKHGFEQENKNVEILVSHAATIVQKYIKTISAPDVA